MHHVYNVTGSACVDIRSQGAPFSINVVATCKRDAYIFAHRGLAERGWTGIVTTHADDLGRAGSWEPGSTLLIFA